MKSDGFVIAPGCAPFLLDGGEVGCVCTHGFTASPEEVRWLSEYLHARGLTVFAPRLAGHGTDPEVMAMQHWIDWYESELDAIALLRQRCRKVFAAGLSMGGLLSLLAGASGLVDGVVAMAAPLDLDRRDLSFAPILKHALPFIPKDNWPGRLDAYVREVQRAQGRADYGRADYGVTPTAAAGQLHALMGEVMRRLPELTVPLLLIYSRADQTVPYDNLALATRLVNSADLVTHTLETSDHVLTQDVEHETVFALVWDFLSARLA
jgi:carboxylesterase